MDLVLSPTDELLAEVEAEQPTNPFATSGYARALRAAGSELAVLRLGPELAALATIRRGRIGAVLEVPSLPGPVGASDLNALRDLARRHRITTLSLQTFASPASAHVSADRDAEVTARAEYVWDIGGPGDLMASLSRTHRERARKAVKAGIQVTEALATEAIASLVALHEQSMDRREQRGESVPHGNFRMGRFLLEHAGARVFRAELEGKPLGAVLVAVARDGAYTVYSGNAPEGTQLGAAHLLRLALAERMRAQGRSVLNLGGASAGQEGLADFKRRFGAMERPLQHTSVRTATPWRRLLISGFNFIRR